MRLDVNVDAYVPADYIPYEQAKIDVHRRIAGAREVADLELLRDELEDRFGPIARAAAATCSSLQQARIKLGQAGRDRGDLPRRAPGRHADRARLDPRQAAARSRSPRRSYESGKSQLSVRVPDEPEQRFPAVVRAADVLLAVHARGGLSSEFT